MRDLSVLLFLQLPVVYTYLKIKTKKKKKERKKRKSTVMSLQDLKDLVLRSEQLKTEIHLLPKLSS